MELRGVLVTGLGAMARALTFDSAARVALRGVLVTSLEDSIDTASGVALQDVHFGAATGVALWGVFFVADPGVSLRGVLLDAD